MAVLAAWPARWLIAWRISPNAITVAGLAGTAANCMYYIHSRNTLVFCGLVVACGLCDALDGAVARLSSRTSRWGSYLDAMTDRYGEAMVALTVAWVTGYWVLIGAVLKGSLLVSYAKARAAMEVAVTNTEWPDVMERTERGLIFIAGLVASALTTWRPGGRDIFWWTLVMLAVCIHATVLQRMWRARQFIRTRTTG